MTHDRYLKYLKPLKEDIYLKSPSKPCFGLFSLSARLYKIGYRGRREKAWVDEGYCSRIAGGGVYRLAGRRCTFFLLFIFSSIPVSLSEWALADWCCLSVFLQIQWTNHPTNQPSIHDEQIALGRCLSTSTPWHFCFLGPLVSVIVVVIVIICLARDVEMSKCLSSQNSILHLLSLLSFIFCNN